MKMEVRPIDANRMREELLWGNVFLDDGEINTLVDLIDNQPTLTQPNEWVSVESPPKEQINGTGVLIFRGKSGFEEVGVYYNGLFWSYDEDGDMHYADDVTHWAPLPAPPRKEENNASD